MTGRGDAVIAALGMDLPNAGKTQSLGGGAGGGGGGGGGSGGFSNGGSTDSGTHQAMDAQGNVYTVNSTYGGASPGQQDDMNRYANTIGNFASSTS